MTSIAAIFLSSSLFGQVIVGAAVPQPAGARPTPPGQPAAKSPDEGKYPNGAVFTLDNDRFEGPITSLADGKVAIDSDPPKTLRLDQVERIELGLTDAPTMAWIGQENRDLVKDSGTPGTNGIQDLHLRCTGISPSRQITQVVVTAIVGGAPQIWLLEPNNTPFWRLNSERQPNSTSADFFLEPPPTDCFEQPFEITLTFNDKRTVKSTIKATTHSDSKLKVVQVEKTEAKPATVPGAALAYLLGDQSVHGQLVAIEKDFLGLKLPNGERLDIPLSDVLACWLGGEQAEQRKMFDERRQARAASDWALIMEKDNTPAAAVEGNVQGIVDGKLEFVVEGETRKVGIERLLGLVLAVHPPKPASDAFYQVYELTNGDKLHAQLSGITPESLTVHSLWGGELKLPRTDVRGIVCRNGQATYLSDLEPVAVEDVAYFTRRQSYRRDQNLLGEPIVLGGTKYRKGLAVHARSMLTYALDGRFETFRANIGFDDASPPGGSVVCRVLADDREIYSSTDLRQNTQPVPLKLELAGAKQLVLEVDFGQFADVGDRIIWAGAQVFRSETPKADAVTASQQAAKPETPPKAEVTSAAETPAKDEPASPAAPPPAAPETPMPTGTASEANKP